MNISGKHHTCSVKETEQLGELFANELKKNNILNTVVAFFGGLGMGKTAFVRGMAKGLGYRGEVSSPTFAIVHEYTGGDCPLFHFDMYRIENFDDLYSCGFFDYLESGISAIEWSENIENALPDNTIRIIFTKGTTDDEREIEIK